MIPASNLTHRNDIDGLRAVALFWVVGYHFFPNIFPGGFSGVDVFFVISGFLITRLIHRDLSRGSFSLANFFFRRALRLLPALLVVLIASLIIGWFVSVFLEYEKLGHQVFAGALFASNFQFWSEGNYFGVETELKPLLHLWSLAVEEQFYLFWPFWILLTRKRFVLCTILLAAASFALNFFIAGKHPETAFYFPFTRLWEFAAGGLISALARQRQLTEKKALTAAVFGLGLVIAALFISKNAMVGWVALLPVLGSAILLYAAPPTWIGQRFFSHPFFARVAAISYSAYLWHWPLLTFTRLHLCEVPPVTTKLGLLALTAFLAAITHYGLEVSLKALSPQAKKRSVQWAVVAMGLVAFLGFALQQRRIQSPVQRESLAYLRPFQGGKNAKDFWREIKCFVLENTVQNFDQNGCGALKKPGAPVVMVVGDSMSAYLMRGVLPLVAEREINVVHLSGSACLPFRFEKPRNHCRGIPEYVEQKIKQLKPDLLVITLHHLFYSVEATKGKPGPYEVELAHAVANFSRDGAKKIIVIGQMPWWKEELSTTLYRKFVNRRQPIPDRNFSELMPNSLQWDEIFLKQTLPPNVEFFSLKNLFCNDEGCLTQLKYGSHSFLVVEDRVHYGPTSANFVALKVFAPYLVGPVATAE